MILDDFKEKMLKPQDPFPPYQAMIANGAIPQDSVVHKPDTYVWREHTVQPGLNVVLRATYYTYASGDNDKVASIAQEIKQLTFRQYDPPQPKLWTKLPDNLSARIFKKERGKKAKGVDIQMTVDIMTHVYQNNLDVVYLVSGDGDYFPVIDEVIRNGKQIYVAALSDGLSPLLVERADKFFDLDRLYFNPAHNE